MATSDVDPHLFVVFGATGDLAHRKLLPALYRLMKRREIAERCVILGTARADIDDDAYREQAREALAESGLSEDNLAQWCDRQLHYQSVGEDNDYNRLRERIAELEEQHDLPGNRVFYLSIPPSAYEGVVSALDEDVLQPLDRSGWTRLVVEKPFGYDLESARELNALIHARFDESQVYRIDHFLGKETVQNLLALRFANPIFERLWNRDGIEYVEITVAETLGLEGRAGYYDEAGHLRDMIQNHLTQLFTLVAMEPPTAFASGPIHREKIKVLESVRLRRDHVVFGQYTAGEVDGEQVPGYAEEEGIEGTSDTETFVALELQVNNWRWEGVPFYLRTGKRMPADLRQIAIRFRCAPYLLFEGYACDIHSNTLLITLQPEEGFDLLFEVKKPGEPFELVTEGLRFRYADAFREMPPAYETLLHATMQGDRSLFVWADEVEAAWELYEPLLNGDVKRHPYPAGTWGPEETRQLLTNWTNTSS